MEGMVHGRAVDDIPDLQLADPAALGVMVNFLVDRKIHSVLETELPAQLNDASWLYGAIYEWLDIAELLCNERPRRSSRADSHGRKEFALWYLERAPIVLE